MVTFDERIWQEWDAQKQESDDPDPVEFVDHIFRTASQEVRNLKESGELDLSYYDLEVAALTPVDDELGE